MYRYIIKIVSRNHGEVLLPLYYCAKVEPQFSFNILQHTLIMKIKRHEL